MDLKSTFNHSRFSDYAAHLKAQGLSDSSINRKLSSLASFQKFLLKKKYLRADNKTLPQPLPCLPAGMALTGQGQSKNSSFPPVKGDQGGFFPNSQIPVPKSQIPFLSRYAIIAAIILLLSGLAYGIYNQVYLRAKLQLAYSTAASPVRPGRQLSFQGRLTDTAGNPISSPVRIQFRLYDTDVGGTSNLLYDSWTDYGQGVGTTTVDPDDNGIFSALIGKTHGGPISPTVFSENAEVWLSITVGGETMQQRQQIATVAYALNADTLQGMPPSASGLKDTVLVIDGSGNINLGETSPTIVSQSGTFGLIGNSLLIGTTDLSDGNITINPDGSGILKLITEGNGSTAVGGFIEATNANLSAGNLYSGLIRNDNRGYNFVSYQNYNVGTTQLSTRFAVDASGNTYASGLLSIGTGATIPQITLNIGASAGYMLQSDAFGNAAWVPATGIGGTLYTGSNGINLSGSTFKLGGELTESTRLNIGNTEVLYLSSAGNIGLGTTSPSTKIDISGKLNLSDGSYGTAANFQQSANDYFRYQSRSLTLAGVNSHNNPLGMLFDSSGTDFQIILGAFQTYGTNTRLISSSGFDFKVGNIAENNAGIINALSISNAGLIGLGTSAPLYKLDVAGDINLTGTILASGTSGSSGQILSSTGTGLQWLSAAAIGGTQYTASNGLTLTGSDFKLGGALTENTRLNIGNTEVMYVDYATGRIGIGTTNPTQAFDVRGVLTVDTANLYVKTRGTNFQVASNDNNHTLRFTPGSTGIIETMNWGDNLNLRTTSGSGTVNHFAFTNEGLFGLGTTAPSQKLDVVGNINLSGTILAAGTSGTSGQILSSTGTGLSWVTASSIGGTNYSAGNGLTLSGSQFKLGGTLSEATSIGTSSFGLSFTGLGGTQSLYVASNGNVGIGNTSPSNTLTFGNSSETTYQSILLNTNTRNTGAKYALDIKDDSILNDGQIFRAVGSYYDGYTGYFYRNRGSTNMPMVFIHQDYGWASPERQSALSIQQDSAGVTSHILEATGASGQKVVINSSGSIGIGTTVPTSKLHVIGDATITTNLNVGGTLTFTGINVGTGTTALFIDSSGVVTQRGLGALAFADSAIGTTYAAGNGLSLSSNIFKLGGNLTENTQIGTSSFGLSFLGLGGTQSLFIAANGNVGIGTSNPSTLLDVNGITRITHNTGYNTTTTDGNIVLVNPNNTSAALGVTSDGNLRIKTSSLGLMGSSGQLWFNRFGLNSIQAYTTDFAIFTSGDAERLRISKNTGNVGIGTSSPTSKLDVAGDINLTGTIFAAGTSGVNGQILQSTGAGLQWVTASSIGGTNYTASSGLQLVNSDFQLDLGSSNVWLATQTFAGGIGLTASVGTGTTALMIDSNGLVTKRALGSLAFADTAIGTTYAAANGLTLASDIFKLGGTLSEATSIGTSSFGLSFTGLGGTQSLYVASNGNVGIGTTDSIFKLQVIGTSNTQVLVVKGSLNQTTNLQEWQNNSGVLQAGVGNSGSFYVGGSPLYSNLYFRDPDGGGNFNNYITTNYFSGWFYFNKNIIAPGLISNFARINTILTNSNGKHTMFIGESQNNTYGTIGIGTSAIPASYQTIISNSIGTTNLTTLGLRAVANQTGNLLSWEDVGGTKLGVISAAGNLGLGTTNPGAKLDVAGDINLTGTILAAGTTGASGQILQSTGTGLQWIDSNSAGIGTTYGANNGLSITNNVIGLGGTLTQNTQIGTSSFSLSFQGLNNAQSLYISSGGNIGIGTTSPTSNLQVAGANANFRIQDTNSTNAVFYGAYLDYGQLSVNRNPSTGTFTDTNKAAAQFSIKGAANDGHFEFYTSNANNSAPTEKLRISATGGLSLGNAYVATDPGAGNAIISGNIGIGTTAPTSKLHVIGDANITTNLTVGGTATFSGLNVGTGTTALFVDSNGLVTKRVLGSLAFDSSTYDNYQSWNLQSNGAGTTAVNSNANVNFVNGVGISLAQSGSTITINNIATGTTYAAGVGLTLSSDNIFALNLGSSNVWAAYQTFNGGIGVSGTAALANMTIGTSALVSNLNANYLNGLPSSSFLQIGGTGFFNTALNGLSAIGTTGVGLGGTLSQATEIGTSSFGLSFTGLGGTQSLYIASNGQVGIGTTNPLGKFEIAGPSATNYTALVIGENIYDNFKLEAKFAGSGQSNNWLELNDYWGSNLTTWRNSYLGIGTTNPTQMLTVNGNAQISDILLTESTIYSPNNGLILKGGTSLDSSSQISIVNNDGINIWGRSDAASNIVIDTRHADGNIVLSTGDVGIGTDNPTSKLHVIGDANITTNLTVGGTFISVGSTALVSNLNADLLDGFHASNFLTTLTGGSGVAISGTGIGRTISTTITNGLGFFTGSIGISSPTCNGTDKLQWTGTAFVCAADVGSSYTSGVGLTLQAGNIFALNLGSTHSWTALQTFGAGIGITGNATLGGNLSIGGSFLSVGTSALVSNLNAQYLNGLPSSSFLQIGGTGFFNTALNGLSAIGTTGVGLGGTLSQATEIGTSSFGLSFTGLGGTQSLYIASNGNVGIGTTSPTSKLQINGSSSGGINSYLSLKRGGTDWRIWASDAETSTPSLRIGGSSASSYAWQFDWSGTIANIFKSPNNTASQNIVDIRGATNQSGKYFSITSQSGAVGDIFNVDSNGSVGIGTTAPTSKLHVIGDANITTNLTVGGTATFSGLNVGTGTTALFVDSNGLVTKRVLGSLAFDSSTYDNYQSWNLQSNGAGTTAINSNANVNFVNGVGISLSQSGSSITINNTSIGTTYTSGVGLTLQAGNIFALNLGSSNVWAAYQTFNGGIGVSGTAALANMTIGTSALVSNLNATYLNGTPSTGFVGIGQTANFLTSLTGGSGVSITGSGSSRTISSSITNGLGFFTGSIGVSSPTCNGTDKLQWTGTAFVCAADVNTTYTAGNGITLNNTTFELGGLLTNNTQIGTSSFNLSFLGLGNTQSLFLAANGHVSIGSTASTFKLEIVGDDSLFRLADTSDNTLVEITQSNAEFNLPTAFNSLGDLTVGNDINLTNPGSSTIRSQSPFYLITDHPTAAIDLTLSAANDGQVIIDDSAQISANLTVGSTLTAANLLSTSLSANQLILGGGANPLTSLGAGTSGQILMSNGAAFPSWTDFIGANYTASTGITLVNTDFRLNLGTSNVWLAQQTFAGGIGLTAAVGTGTTALFIDSTGLITKRALGSLAFADTAIGTTYISGIGLTLSSGNIFNARLGLGITTDASNQITLNLGTSNVWLGRQIFNGGIGVSNSLNVGSSSFFASSIGVTGNAAISANLTIGSSLSVASLTANRLILGGGTGNLTALGAGTSGQYLMSNGTASPVWTALNIPASGVTDITAGYAIGITTVGTGRTINFNPTALTTATFGVGSTFSWTFNTGTTDPVIEFKNGYVNIVGQMGIGVTSPIDPLVKLQVNGQIAADKFTDLTGFDRYFLKPANSSDATDSSLSLTGTGSIKFNSYYSTAGSTWQNISAGYAMRIQAKTTGLLFSTGVGTTGAGSNVSSWNNNLFIGGNGRIGIGITNPSKTMHLVGDAFFDGNLAIGATNDNFTFYTDQDGRFETNLEIGGSLTATHILPSANLAYNIGSTTATGRWNNLYLGGTIDLRDASANTATIGVATGSTLVMRGTHVANYLGNTNGSTYFRVLNSSSASIFSVSDNGVAFLAPSTSRLGIGTSSSAGLLYLAIGNTAAFFVHPTSGYVGIGTSAPAARLDIAGATSTISNTAGDITLSAGSSNVSLASNNLINVANGLFSGTVSVGSSLTVGSTMASSTLYVTGNVGLGTISTTAKLHLYGIGDTMNNIRFDWASNTAGTKPTLYAIRSRLDGTGVGRTDVQNLDDLFLNEVAGWSAGAARTAARWGAIVNGTPSATSIPGALYFSTTTAGDASPTERLRITSAGAVGIGTSTPSGLLTVGLAGAGSTGPVVHINSSGQLGVGTTNVAYRLQVEDNSAAGTAYFRNYYATGTTVPTVVIQTTSTGLGTTGAEFIRFLNAAGTKIGRIRLATATTVALGTSGTNDLAEYVLANMPTGIGDLVAYTGTDYTFTLATPGSRLAGIHSSYATLVGNESLIDRPNAFPMAISGIVKLKVSTDNGPISVGDPLGQSHLAGVASKATQAGYIVARALESYSASNPDAVGIIEVQVSLTWYDPDVYLTDAGQVHIDHNLSPEILASLGYQGAKNEIESAQYSVTDEFGHLITRIGNFSEIAVAKIKSGLITTENLIAKNIISETTKSKTINTAIISPLSDISDTITLDGNVAVSNTLQANKIGASEATFGVVYADNIISKEGSFGSIMADRIAALRSEIRDFVTTTASDSASAAITGSTILAESQNWAEYISFTADNTTQVKGNLALTDNLTVGANLAVHGQTQLADAFITGTFSVGQIAIKDNYLETTAAALYLQPSGLGSVDIMNHTLVIAENGGVQINGNLDLNGSITAQSASVSGSFFANLVTAVDASISGKLVANQIETNKLTVATDSASLIIADSGFAALATSSAQLSSNATAGTATLPAGKTEIVIYNNQVSSSSMVYLTPTGSTQNQVVYVKNKFTTPTPNPSTQIPNPNYFTIAIDQPLAQNIDINWWIIN